MWNWHTSPDILTEIMASRHEPRLAELPLSSPSIGLTNLAKPYHVHYHLSQPDMAGHPSAGARRYAMRPSLGEVLRAAGWCSWEQGLFYLKDQKFGRRPFSIPLFSALWDAHSYQNESWVPAPSPLRFWMSIKSREWEFATLNSSQSVDIPRRHSSATSNPWVD